MRLTCSASIWLGFIGIRIIRKKVPSRAWTSWKASGPTLTGTWFMSSNGIESTETEVIEGQG